MGYNGVLFDMDGCLYTTVLAALAKDTIGNHVKAIIMPSGRLTNHDDMCDAIDLAASLKIKYRIQDLTYIYNEITRGYPETNKWDPLFDNTARLYELIKLSCLYHEADRLNYAVIGVDTQRIQGLNGLYRGTPLDGLLPEDIAGMASVLGVPEHIISK